MVQLLLGLLVGIGVIVVWRTLAKEMKRVEKTLSDDGKGADKQANKPEEIETLEKDEDGVYRPKD